MDIDKIAEQANLVHAYLEETGRQGWTVETLGDAIVMHAAASWEHNEIMLKLVAALGASDRYVTCQTDLVLPEGAGEPVPDVMVLSGRPAPGAKPTADEAELVVEIVSPRNVQADTSVKRAAYAKARIPFYLIFDPRGDGTITLLARPEGSDWRTVESYGFGDIVTVLGVRIHTYGYPTYTA